MTAPIATATNTFTGLRELGQVTNTYSGYLQSAGAAYNLVLPWQADKLEWYNYTKFATNDQNVQGVWYRDFPAGDALIVRRATTNLTSTLEATNGVTIANTTGGFVNGHRIISGITTASPAVVTTTTAHGYTTGDRVIFTKIIGSIAQELNNQTFVVTVLSPTTFSLYDVFGLPITTVGSYTSSGQSTLTGPVLGVVDVPVSYRLTLGSAVMGNDNDVIYFTAYKYNAYFNLGDVA